MARDPICCRRVQPVGLGVGGSMAGRVPGAGPWLVRQMLGGPVLGAGLSAARLSGKLIDALAAIAINKRDRFRIMRSFQSGAIC